MLSLSCDGSWLSSTLLMRPKPLYPRPSLQWYPFGPDKMQQYLTATGSEGSSTAHWLAFQRALSTIAPHILHLKQHSKVPHRHRSTHNDEPVIHVQHSHIAPCIAPWEARGRDSRGRPEMNYHRTIGLSRNVTLSSNCALLHTARRGPAAL